LTFEWRPTDRAPMVEYLKRKRRRFYSQRQSSVEGALEAEGAELQKDAAMTENAETLNQAIRELRNRGNYFCDYSMTVVVFDRDETNLRRSCQLTKQAFADKGATLMEETQNAVRAFFATLPGNSVLNLRYRSLQNLNIADLTPCYKPSEGSKRNDYLEDEYMTVMQTADNTVRYLNLHYGEVAATLITGTTGSGKSLLIDQFIDDAQKYDPYTFVLDVGGSHRLSTRRHNGVYSHVRLNEKSFGVNPFRQPYGPQSVNVILEFLRVLLHNEGHVMTSDEEQLILREIHIVFGLPENRRRIGKLSLPRDLRERLHFWLDGGPFSHFVDSDRDDLILSKFQTWDFTDLEEVPKLLGPLMWYLSRWISRVVTDPGVAHQAKVCFMDEAWRFGDLEDFIRSAAKTWRKHRAWIVLATQDEEDLRKNNILQLVNTQCHTKIFMSNPGADVRLYSDTFKFNEREAELLETMKIGEFFVKTPADSYLCIYNPSTQRLAEYKTQFQSQIKEKDLATL
jgi:type IV secretory pathway VirB4 component